MTAQQHFVSPRDIPLAIALLTRLPFPVDAAFAARRGAGAAWAYPLAGLVVALLAGGFGVAALAAGVPSWLAAGLALSAQVILTGAMHEDGLADTADGLWGGWDRARRLEIMKDSHIGSYGVLALVLTSGLRWGALASLGAALLPVLLAAALLSRACMVAVMAGLPHARDTGLSRAVGRPSLATAGLAVLLAVVPSVAILGKPAIGLFAAAALAAMACAAIARRKIGGQTGDVLGATQVVTEIVCFLTAVLPLSGIVGDT